MPRTNPPVSSQPLADLLLKLLKQLGDGREEYGLLDYPSHYNIGDSAIWMGEVSLLGRLHGAPAKYVSHSRYPVAEVGRFLRPDDLIYLHGGGNFGDIWPQFQAYREAILQHYPQHRIVQLPQSLHYREPEGIERTKRAIGTHRDFHLMVRDHESFDLASREFDCEVILAPDSAFGIDVSGFVRENAPQKMIALLRSDQERRADALAGRDFFKDVVVEDWNRVSDLRRRIQKLLMGGLGVASVRILMTLREEQFTVMARERVNMGFKQLDCADVIVTDRLHGHIMATLLAKPHVVIDNSYGKISRFIAAWGTDEKTLVAQNYSQARDLANQLLKLDRM